jgi:FixJ family two-component response regulator
LALFDAKIAILTLRDHEVPVPVVAGKMNKQITYQIGTVEKTIKFRRSATVGKLGVRTVAELVRDPRKAGLSSHTPHNTGPKASST